MDKALPATLKEFVDEAKYQEAVLKMLRTAKALGATQAEIGLASSTGFNVTVRKQEVETVEFNRDKAVGVTVYWGKQKGTASTTDISDASLQSAVEAAINLAKLTEPDAYAGLADPEEMASKITPLDLYHPWDLTIDRAIDLTKTCEQSAFSLDKKITNSEGATLHSTQGYHVYGNSHGFLGAYPASRHSLSCVVIAQSGQQMERDYEYTVGREESDLDRPEKVGKGAAERALKRLDAQKLSTRRTPVLYHADVAGGLISHFMSAISGGRLFRKSSFLLDSLHQKRFPEFMHIYERPHIQKGLASAPFDADGVRTRDKDIVREGIIENYILSAYSARKLGLPNTGNAGGTHNVFVQTGKEDFQGLLKKMDRGLVVMELMGQGINLVTGDYSRGVMGFWVESGHIQYPVHEITIAGNLQEMFKKIVAIGKDVDKRSSIQTGSILIEEMMLAGD